MTSPNRTPEDELREKLAAIEHERWADWQKWMHSKLKPTAESLELARSDFDRWERQINTPYAELSEGEKQSDRDQVDRYWPLIEAYLLADRKTQATALLERGPDKHTKSCTSFQYLVNPDGESVPAKCDCGLEEWRSIIKEQGGLE